MKKQLEKFIDLLVEGGWHFTVKANEDTIIIQDSTNPDTEEKIVLVFDSYDGMLNDIHSIKPD